MWRSRRKLWTSTAAAFLRDEVCPRSPVSSYPLPIPCPSIPLPLQQQPLGEANGISWRSSCYRDYHYCFYLSSPSSDDTAATVPQCWNCRESLTTVNEPFLACPSCKAVQPVDSSVDYFRIFGLEKGYDILDDNLAGKYKDWQKKLHPDLVHTKSERERGYAAEQSARVIEAYRTLSRPLSRALYLLQLEGLDMDEERTLSDPELLNEAMEIREAVEEANDSKALDQIKSEIQGKLESWSYSFAKAFKNREFEDAVTAVRRMTYFEKAIQEIVKKL